jgi:hypothetical protein
MSAIWFIYAVVGLQLGATVSYAARGNFKLAGYWFVISIANAIAATF